MKSTFEWNELLHEQDGEQAIELPRNLWNRDEHDVGVLDEMEEDRWDEEGKLTGFEEGAERAGDEPFEAEAEDA